MKNLLLFAIHAYLILLSNQSWGAEAVPKEIRFGEVGGTNVKSIGGRPTNSGLVSLAEYLGFFQQEFGKNGPKISQVFFSSGGPAENEALAQGSLDFATYGGVPNVVGLVGGIPAHIVSTRRSTGAGKYYIAVHKDSSIKTIADLRGKRIAVPKGTNPYQSLVKLLEWKGVAEKEVNILNLQTLDGLVAFNSGAVDAVYGGLNLLILRDQGKVKLVEGTEGFKLDPSQSALLVTYKFEKEYPDVVKRVLKVLIKTSHWASEEKNRESLLKFVSERSLAYKYVAEDYKGSLKERYNPLIDESSVAAFRATVKFCAERGAIRKVVDEATIRKWFRPEYQQAAIKELNLEKYWTESIGPFSKGSAQ
jgi:sulfonate transport system substrate-binding protein